MKILILSVLAFASLAHADQYVNGYVRRDGTYVQPHIRSNPDGNPYNNYGSQRQRDSQPQYHQPQPYQVPQQHNQYQPYQAPQIQPVQPYTQGNPYVR